MSAVRAPRGLQKNNNDLIYNTGQLVDSFDFSKDEILNYLAELVKRLERTRPELGLKTLYENIIEYTLNNPFGTMKRLASYEKKRHRHPLSLKPHRVPRFWDLTDENPIEIVEVCPAIGYILSATVVHSKGLDATFYASLLAMYGNWCATICHSLATKYQTCDPPYMASMTYIYDSKVGKVDAVILGASIGGEYGQNRSLIQRWREANVMHCYYHAIERFVESIKQDGFSQLWGHCAETYSFELLGYFLDSQKVMLDRNKMIYGKAIMIVGATRRSTNGDINYVPGICDWNDIEGLDPKSAQFSAIQDLPCANCEALILKMCYNETQCELIQSKFDVYTWGFPDKKS